VNADTPFLLLLLLDQGLEGWRTLACAIGLLGRGWWRWLLLLLVPVGV